MQVISSGVQFDQPVPDQGTTPKTKLTPGWPYDVPPPGLNEPRNYSVSPGSWNRMRIKFTPPTIVGGQITQAAKLKVSFEFANSLYVVFGGSDGWELLGPNGLKLKGTGSRQTGNLTPADVGRVFLQSHWGSLVEYKNPFFV